jgi:hypothetical protein
MTKEVQDMMLSLTAAFQPSQAGVPLESSQPNDMDSPINVLPKPVTMSLKTEYIGTNVKHIVAKPGDHLLVCARTSQFALAFNPRNQTAGRISTCVLEEAKLQQPLSSDICVSAFDHKGDLSGGLLSWTRGEHIRVYQWDNLYKNSGVGLNLATRKIGRFAVSVKELKVIDTIPSTEANVTQP